jgi:hypothetical protein
MLSILNVHSTEDDMALQVLHLVSTAHICVHSMGPQIYALQTYLTSGEGILQFSQGQVLYITCGDDV